MRNIFISIQVEAGKYSISVRRHLDPGEEEMMLRDGTQEEALATLAEVLPSEGEE